ncbi:phosphatase PAP2 family protein [Nocardioides daejeonensis]|uniref:phosphatase PAP2 family protein n=1 Tax=Nocardioides daejeonensis TaxID=1046556 RepID=UPI000D740247|nr:phosphatase PAP2 family protein [Nocardioides daejeonensis]
MASGTEQLQDAVLPIPRRAATRPRVRIVSFGVYLAALTVFTINFGIPSDTVQIFVWLWLATIAWHIEEPWRYHLGFIRDWWAPLLALVVYFYGRGLADELYAMPVAFQFPVDADKWMFGGELPSHWLQERLCGDPCLPHEGARWYDLVFTVVYSTHFVFGLILAVVLWLRNRGEWLKWMRRYIGLNFAGLAIYVFYPMAPPWMAGRDGYLEEQVLRLTSRGWGDTGLGRYHLILTGVGNPVAAMPSLHAGTAFLISFYLIQRYRNAWAWLSLLYPLTMSFGLIYYGEHYVIDTIAGAALAVLVIAACNLWERSRGS